MPPENTSRRPSVLRCLAALGTGLLLGGCANPGTSPQAQVATPASWRGTTPSAARDDAALARWWTQIGDATLDQLIAIALEGNPDLRTAVSRVASARAQHGASRASLFPSLSGGVSSSASHRRDRASDAEVSSQGASASLDASWQIDLFGRQRATVRAAAADIAQAEANQRGAQAALAAEIAARYVTLRLAQAQIAVVRESLDLQNETYQVAQWREQSGNASALETQQALSSLEQARASLPDLEQTVAQTRNDLAVLCGQAPGALDGLLAPAADVPLFRAELAAGIPADTLRQRPDVAAAQHRVEAARARLSAQERERFPSLTLTGTVGVEALRAGDLFSPTDVVSSVVGSVTAPIFTAGRISQQIVVQGENVRQAVIAYESSILTALKEVENALVAVQRTAEGGAILARAVAAAGTAAELAEQQYQAGQTDLLTVLVAQRTYLSLRQQAVSNTAAQTNAGIQLYNALGGGWSS